MNKSQRIEDIDTNFKVQEINSNKYNFLNVTKKPLELDGFAWFGEEGEFCRLPARMLSKESILNDGAKILAWNTSGAMLRFRTNSQNIAIKAELRDKSILPNMPLSGTAGFDFYSKNGNVMSFRGNVRPISDKPDFIEGEFAENANVEMRECMIYLPLYNGIKTMEIGFMPGTEVQAPTPFKYREPILFYGSSITQGGCASRPGNAYTHFLTRWLDANMINLGFSGCGFGEKVMSECIAPLKMSVFVMDYDYNALNPEDLANTHEIFFRTIRAKQPELPKKMPNGVK
ncbi:MAG: hypothetical protein NT118_04345 [Lentisphaerae bacterium]|nr:hypothetical protein [Lentisphaerota bacterium]